MTIERLSPSQCIQHTSSIAKGSARSSGTHVNTNTQVSFVRYAKCKSFVFDKFL